MYRSRVGNRIVSGIQCAIPALSLVFGFGLDVPSTTGVLVAVVALILAFAVLASAFYLVTGRSPGDMSVRGVSHPRLTRTLGFIAAATFSIAFITTAVFATGEQLSRESILLTGLWGYLFISTLSTATIAQAQLGRERHDAG